MRLLPPLALACVGASLVVAAPGAGASATRNCKPPKYPSLGYFNRLTVSGVPCSTGNKVALAYFKCRTHSGKNLSGRCTSTVLGYKCREVRNQIPVEIDARVTCKRPGKTVVHVYQQNI